MRAGSRDEAIEKATEQFRLAVASAGLPASPVVRVDAVSEAEAEGDAEGEQG